MARQAKAVASSTEELLESMRLDAERQALEGIAPALGELVSRCRAAGISIDGGIAARPGRKANSGQAPRQAKPKSGHPVGEVFDEGGRGKKPCPHCGKYIGARASDCPNCFFNFPSGKVKEYADEGGKKIVPPASKRGSRKPAAAAPKANGKANGNGGAKRGKKEEGANLTDDQLDKAVGKMLTKHAGDGGLTVKDMLQGAVKAFGLSDVPGKALQMRLMHALRRKANKVAGTQPAKYQSKAA